MEPFKQTQFLARVAAEKLISEGTIPDLSLEELTKKLGTGPSAHQIFDRVPGLRIRGVAGGAVAWIDPARKFTGRNTHNAALLCISGLDRV